MITEVSVGSYRVLGDVKMAAAPFTVLVGPNACGKSTLLGVIRRMMAAAFDGPNALGTLGDLFGTATASITFAGGSKYTLVSRQPDPGPAVDWHGGKPAPAHQSIDLRLSAEQLKRVVSATHEGGLGSDGFGLAAVLTDLKLNDRFEPIQRALCRIVPSITSLRPERSGKSYRVVFDAGGATGIPASDMSDGTMFALGFLTAIALGGKKPTVVLIDDLDSGLHPRAQQELVAVMRGFLGEQPDTQIIATTHSPYLLDFLQPDEIRIGALDAEGHTHIARLTDHPEFQRWKDVMAPGEFWSSIGEGWVATSGALRERG